MGRKKYMNLLILYKQKKNLKTSDTTAACLSDPTTEYISTSKKSPYLRRICSSVCITVLLTTAKIQRQTGCPSPAEWIRVAHTHCEISLSLN